MLFTESSPQMMKFTDERGTKKISIVNGDHEFTEQTRLVLKIFGYFIMPIRLLFLLETLNRKFNE